MFYRRTANRISSLSAKKFTVRSNLYSLPISSLKICIIAGLCRKFAAREFTFAMLPYHGLLSITFLVRSSTVSTPYFSSSFFSSSYCGAG